jgi:hypothetical protein
MSNATFFSITPSDSAPLQTPIRCLYVGVTGDVAVFGAGDSTATVLKAAPAGWMLLPMPVVQVGATGTTATNLAGCIGDRPSTH